MNEASQPESMLPEVKLDSSEFKDTDIGPILVEWEVVRLADVANTASGGTPSRSNPDYYGGAIPWVKSGELNDSVVRKT